MFPILCLLFLTFQTIRSDLLIKPTDSSLTRDQYRSFVASCDGQGNTRVIGWRSPQQRDIPENDHDRVTIERQKTEIRLRIRNLTIDDQGTWECTGFDASNRQIRKTFQLNIKVPITFHAEPIQYAPLGESVLIKCHVQASPSAEVSWFKGQEKTRIDGSQYNRVKEGLRINRVEMSDNDTFICRADVLETGESQDYPITVIISKSVTTPRISCATPCAIEKKTATLVCESTGLPPPKFAWYYGSADELRQVKDSPVGASEVPKFVVRGNQLTINYVDETDNGKYSCHAYNEFDRQGQRAEFNLNVIVPPRLTTIQPIEISLDEQYPQQVSFDCRVERGSAESLTLEWQHLNNTPIQQGNGIFIDRSQMEAHRLIQLRFDPVRREHFGNYSCVAKNLADRSYSMASLRIQFPPIFMGPSIQTVSTIPNYRVVMRCQFESYPPPQIQWIKMTRTAENREGRVLAMDLDSGVNDITTKQIDSTLFESVLSYTPAESDFGFSFECRAMNPRVGRHSFTLKRAEPPKKVRINEVKPMINAVELIIEPAESGGLPLTEYTVKYDLFEKPEGEGKTLTIPAQNSLNETLKFQVIKLDQLKPSTSYRFTISAKSRAGVGQQTGPIQFRTLDRKIPEFKIVPNEENQNETCSNDRTCIVGWSVESDGGAPIVRTEIGIALAKNNGGLENEGSFSAPIEVDPSLSEFEIQGLKPQTSYIVLVRLINEAGAAEQKIRVKTTKEKAGSFIATLSPSIKNYRRNQPSKLIIFGIIFGIIIIAIGFVAICVLIRFQMANSKHKTNDSIPKKKTNENQTALMIPENKNGAHSDQKGHTNGSGSRTEHDV